MRTYQGEACDPMIELDILPRSRLMTTGAVRAELSVMCIFRGMTGITIRRCTFITIRMAIDTCNSAVTALQRETRPAVVEVNILPTAWVMTICTITSHLPGMRIFMAGDAVHGCSLEQEIIMATRAGKTGMLSNQMESGLVMVEGNILPGRGTMAGLAFLSQQSHMRIILPVTGKTIHGCAFENIIYVTTTARHTDMGR